jgi:hypothetical protein
MGGFFTAVGVTLSAVAQHYGMEAKLLEYRLQRRWPEIVGRQIAAHTWPEAVRFKKLYLIAESSVWLQQLTFLKFSLIEKINQACGTPAVSDLVLRIGEIGPPGSSCGTPRAGGKAEGSHEEVLPSIPDEPSAQSLARAAVSTDAVTDPDVRERLTSLLARAFSRLDSKRSAP